ncbi:MAG: hypothetical protein IJ784_07875 [Ruminiclostridium sp.]|nr:hypothetical protein [Ruminiclostridium sp.]
MKITIECECGNKRTMEVPTKKSLLFRDNLEAGHFRYTASNADVGKLREFRIHCDKCDNWMTIDVD